MKLIDDWLEHYMQDDAFRRAFHKQDLVYLLNKYGRKKDGMPPTRNELMKLKRKQLTTIWLGIKPFEMGKLPQEIETERRQYETQCPLPI